MKPDARGTVRAAASRTLQAASAPRARGVPIALMALLALLTGTAGVAHARSVLPLDDAWRFVREDRPRGAPPPPAPEAEPAQLPHTWNGVDGEAGGPYHRGAAWYRREVQRAALPPGERQFLEFDGAALEAELWVNGQLAGRHEGGYARFRFDITPWLRPGANDLAVRVDNTSRATRAPLAGDFTVFGGLYRSVRAIGTHALHLDLLDHGGPGVQVSVPELGVHAARVHVRPTLRNTLPRAQRVELRATLHDAEGRPVATARQRPTVAARATATVPLDLRVPRPRAWQGVHDPYLYRLSVQLLQGGRAIDHVTLPLGLRQVAIDPQRGLLLNGRPYALRGANYFHPGRPGRGVAVGEAEVLEDFRLLRQMGVTGLRLVHYQHPPAVYEQADRHGFLLWTEVPLNSTYDEGTAFRDNLRQQLRELMRQTGHHASVVVWGLGNELFKADAGAVALVRDLHQQAKAEDPTRPTAYAHCCAADDHPLALQADLTGYNRYMGWYEGQAADIGAWADRVQATLPQRALGLGEYGAGASVLHQQDPPGPPQPNSRWHPEQFQALFHETYWAAFEDRPGVWGTFIWLAFDHASAGRNEGDRPGINDKGLVTYDRRTTKDAYHYYRARWSREPMAHITSRRHTPRPAGPLELKVYTNGGSATLRVDDHVVGTARVERGIARWADLRLTPGTRRLQVSTDHGATDTVEWTLTP